MARPLRLEFPGALYHVSSRGNARQAIFLDDGDRLLFLEELGRCVQRFRWICHGYCLMDNHYHLVLETPEANLSRGMRHLNGVYTQRFNCRHARVGHVFQGRYRAILVERDSYLLELARYVVLNPVRAGMVKAPDAHPWSSYRATAGLSEVPPWLAVDWIWSQFGERKDNASSAYRKFVGEGMASRPWDELKGQVFLGKESFVARMRALAGNPEPAVEVPKAQRHAGRPALDELLPEEGWPDKTARNRAVREACLVHGYTLTEVAHRLGLHYTTVSKIVNARDEM